MRKPLELVIAGMQRIADGDLDHRLAGGGDVTGRIGDTFNQMADRLQGMVQGQRQLMAAVSHEVRTPLARMRIQTELLRDSGADEKRVTAMEGEIAEVDELIGELLESARLDQGILILDLCEIDLRDLAMNALGSLDLGEHPVTLSIPPGLRVRGDNRRILRAVSNLLSNVVRYTPPQTPVSIDMAEEDHGVRIAVSDEGPGVDPVDLSRLFDPFFRAEESRSRVTGGLGVGLMLVRQIARAHGGWVRAENREGGGLVVTLWFPSTHSDQSSSSSM
jgi:signal transduction histidine kinase